MYEQFKTSHLSIHLRIEGSKVVNLKFFVGGSTKVEKKAFRGLRAYEPFKTSNILHLRK